MVRETRPHASVISQEEIYQILASSYALFDEHGHFFELRKENRHNSLFIINIF